jgi:tetratricopeptide (TPR) repeat protein
MGRKLALLIGNSRYDDPGLARLETADVDVREIADVLRAREIGEFDEVIELPDQGLAVVRRAIAQFFRQGKRDDLLVFYFSGHGVKDENGHLYLAVKDTELPLLAGTSIEAPYITAQMDGSNSRRQVLILDCCHSGAFALGAKGGGAQSVGIGPAFEGRGYGHVVLTATDSTQYAWEGDQIIGESDKSVFTHYLLQGLKTGEADGNGDGVITIDELYEYVFDHVVRETPKQTPGKWSYKQQGDIVIAQNSSRVRPAPLSMELQALLDSPFSRLRAEAIPELTSLLQGQHRGLALAARQALEKLCADDSKKVSAAAEEVLRTLPSPSPMESGSSAAAGQDAAWRAGERTLLLRRGRTAIDEKRFADALIDLTQARLLDPQHPEIAGLLQRAHSGQSALEAERLQREVARFLTEASQRLAKNDFVGALGQVNDALELDGSSEAAAALKGEIHRALEEADRRRRLEQEARERDDKVVALVSSVETAPTHEAAIAALSEALALDSEHKLASQLLAHHRAALEVEAAERVKQRERAARQRVEGLLERGALDEAEQALVQAEAECGDATAFADERRRVHSAQHDRLASEAVNRAKDEFVAGRRDAAVALLERFHPSHPAVSKALADHRAEIERLRQEVQRKAEWLARERRIASLRDDARQQLDRQEFIEALDTLGQIQQLDPEARGLPELIERAEAGRAAQAEMERRRVESMNRLADATKKFRRHDHAAAAALIEEALRIDPRNVAAIEFLEEVQKARLAEKVSQPRTWWLLQARGLAASLALVAFGFVTYGVWNRGVPAPQPSDSRPSDPGPSNPQVIPQPEPPPTNATPADTVRPEPPKENVSSPTIEKTTPRPSADPAVTQREQPKPIPPRPAPTRPAPSGVELKIQALLTQGDEAFAARRYDDAIAAYDQASRLGSEAGRARAEKARSEVEAARAEADRSQKERASQVRQRLSRAEQLLDLGRYQEALGQVDEALKLEPKSAEATALRQKINDAWSFEKNVLR